MIERPPARGEETSDNTPIVEMSAVRLSFGLWDSLPDRGLAKLAAQGALHTPEQVGAQAQRMLGDPRAHAKM